MKQTFLSDNHIRLRTPEPEDLDAIYEIENDSSLWKFGISTPPYSRFAFKQYIENCQHDLFADKQLRLMIVEKNDDKVVGMIDIYDFVPLHSHAAVGMVIHPSFRQKGYATGALILLCRYASGFLHLKQLYAHIAINNSACRRLFASHGFVECGQLKEWLHTEDGYKDAVIVQRVLDR
ncbi:Spermidine N(1)-acetyltransferase [termite gut metagenome]|uniref:Spermidine N(1)-acetyltransferase n=1 Tax=termite gut metagenome TaxID=433724 RepID=A0A5J4Q217_9ZZZZ